MANVFKRAYRFLDHLVAFIDGCDPSDYDPYASQQADETTAPVVYRQSSVLDPVQERQDAMARLAYRQVVALEVIASELKTLNARPAPQQAPIIIQRPAYTTPAVQQAYTPPAVTPAAVASPLTTLVYASNGAVVGYKYLIQRPDGYYSPTTPALWKNNELQTDGRIPSENEQDHGHGIYAMKHYRAPELLKYSTKPGSVLVQIHAWGKIAEYEKGFRAEYARINMVLDPNSYQWMTPRTGA